MFTLGIVDRCLDHFDTSPWPATSGRIQGANVIRPLRYGASSGCGLYTPEQRRRRDASPWTLVQGILAPIQFLIFLISFGLVLRYLYTGEGLELAAASVVVKTLVLYTIMITGSIWEKEVFGCYLFARPFFWEDVFSILVLTLHTAYLIALVGDFLPAREQMLLALAAYATYVVNATQFLLKLRAARLEEAAHHHDVDGAHGAAA